MGGGQFGDGHFWDSDVQVNAIKNGATDFFLIAVDGAGQTLANPLLAAVVAAGAGVGGGNENKLGGVAHGACCPTNLDDAVFHGLPDGFEDVAGKLGEFVQKENTAVGQRNLAGHGFAAAADQTNARSGVVGGAERALPNDSVAGGNVAGNGVDFGDFDGFGFA